MLNASDPLRREEFLSEEDLDLINLTPDELISYWNLWLAQAQATNEADADEYSHGVFMSPREMARLTERNAETERQADAGES